MAGAVNLVNKVCCKIVYISAKWHAGLVTVYRRLTNLRLEILI